MKMSELAKRWQHRCAYCDKPLQDGGRYDHPDAPTRDHFIPRCKGGRRGENNSVYACWSCNQLKGSVDPRRLLWVWLRMDPMGLVACLLSAMEGDGPKPPLRIIVDNTRPDDD